MNEEFERQKLCYEQNCEHMRSLNQIMWQVPIIAMTLTGGLWYGIATLSAMQTGIKVALLVFGAAANIALIGVIQRVRFVMAAYLDKIKEFHPAGFADTKTVPPKGWRRLLREQAVVDTFSIFLATAAGLSIVGAVLIGAGILATTDQSGAGGKKCIQIQVP